MSEWDDDLVGGEDVGDEAPVRSRWAVLVPVCAVIAVVGLVVVVLATREPAANRIVDSPLVGEAAPAIAGTAIDGQQFDLADEAGEWVLVNFFATWCTPCQREHPDLRAFDERHRAIGDATVVSVVFDDRPESVRAFFEENGGSWPVVTSNGDRIALDYGVGGIPESYLVAPDGIVVAKIIGGVTDAGLEDLLARARGE